MKYFKTKFLAITLAVVSLTSCGNDDDVTPTVTVNVPEQLTINDDNFYPEDITISDNKMFLSGFGDGTVKYFDLTAENPTAMEFAPAIDGYAQGWGLKSNGTVLLSLLNNADFTGNPPGASKLVEYNMSGIKTNEWDLPNGTIGHTVSIVDGKYYVSDFANPRIIQVDPSTGEINAEWFTSSQWNPSIDGNLGGTIYDAERKAFYIYLGFKLWYLPVSNGTPGTLQEVSITGLTTEQINMDGISWGADNNTLFYASNDTMNPAKVGTAFKLKFSDATTAIGSVVATGMNDTSGVWYLNNNGTEYLFVCESQFGALFGFNTLETPFNIEVIKL